jgi:hypothetical protein
MAAEKAPRDELQHLLGLNAESTPAFPDLAGAKLGGWWTRMLAVASRVLQSLTCFAGLGSLT